MHSSTAITFHMLAPLYIQAYLKVSEELAQAGLAETLDACALAFFHEALVGDGDPTTAELTYGKRAAVNSSASQVRSERSITVPARPALQRH